MNPNYGDSIEDYEVLDLLGKGGFATVFRARSKHNNQEVAIKKIDRKLMQARNMVSRVKNEIMVQHQLKHPSVLELYNFFEDENYVYLVLELADNGALNKFLKTKQTKLREADAGRLFRQVVEGLLYLHSHMIMHRDLSLSNILLTKQMDAKIADFGLSIQLKAEDEKHYTMCGTANYIAPEVAERGPHGLESDVWSLGCMLYTMMVGHPPFDTEGLTNTLMRVVSAEFKLPREMSPEAQDIISAMLKKNPSDRLKISEIFSHPFMTKQSHSHQQQQHQQHTQLYQRHTPVTRGPASNSLGSIDSGHETQYTSSLHHTSSSSSSRQGPLRATVVPRAINNYAPGTTHRMSDSRNSGGGSIVSNCSSQPDSSGKSRAPFDTGVQQHQGEFLYRRANSLEALGVTDMDDSGLREAWSYHSDSAAGGRGRAHSHSGQDKENRGQSKITVEVRSQQGGQHRRPLGDSTNRCGGRTTPARPAVPVKEERERSGSLKGLVPPLNAARLRPVVQHKQNAVVSIAESGKVWIKLLSHRHTPRPGSSSSQSADSEIVQISPNGMEIELFRPLTSTSHTRHTASTEHEGFYLHACYTYHDLPSRYWKKYQYASQFVGLLRSRTAKVTLYTGQAKCVLMENTPNPDYEANFYNGVKIHQSADTTRFIEEGGHTYTVEEGGGMDIPQTMLPFYQHAQESLQKCREIEEAMTSLEKQGGGGAYFPVMAGRKQQAPRRDAQTRPSSAATSIASCATAVGSSMQRLAVSRSCSKENLSSHSPYGGHQRHRNSSVSSSGRSQSGVDTDAVIRSVRVDGAGKAVQLASGAVLIQYNDGSQLKLQSSCSGSFKYTDPQGKEFMFDKSDKVPTSIKHKLDYLPKVMDHFLRQSQKH